MTYPMCIFEDDRYSQLYPLTLTRPVFDVRCGISTLKEKIIRRFSHNPLILFCRSYLKDYIQQQNQNAQVNRIDSEECLFINGRLIADAPFAKALETLLDTSKEQIFFYKGQVVAAFLKGENGAEFVDSLEKGSTLEGFGTLPRVEIEGAKLIQYPWDLVHHNSSEIVEDFHHLNRGGIIEGNVSDHALVVNKDGIFIGKDSIIKPGAVLDAEEGPIYIGDDVTVMANAVIQGPAFVGNRSLIKISAKIYEGTSIGEVCKVGGEVEESIIHSYSNKQHEGFLGHAYVCQWVNLGADTNNSDLKNNYGSVKVYIDGKLVDSGSMFVGLFIGDHSKSGINTMFNTGTVVGTMCNVFGSDYPPKYIPSFSWGGGGKIVEHDLEKALKTAQQVMARRKKTLTPEYERIFRHVFELTRDERKQK